MLIDNKFICLSLPRCASTAFNYSCILNNVNVQTFNGEWEIVNSEIDFSTIEKSKLMDYIYHGHESLFDLQSKFGNKYQTIAIKRDRYDRFFSLYKHILFDLQRLGHNDIHDVFSKFTLDDLFFFNTEDLVSKKRRWDIICDYLINLGLLDKRIDISVTAKFRKSEEEYFKKNTKGYVINLIDILLTPISYWTHNDPEIIWFDFNEMDKLEKWVENILGKPFKLYSVNSSKHMKCDLVLDDKFKERYAAIYDYYDIPKIQKSII